jgi:predicted oxidoreductase
MGKKDFSRIIAGTMTWGSWGKDCNTNQMIELMNCCVENNITTFDHADIYGSYTTEASFGKAFGESQIKRENVQFISKCGIKYVSENRDYWLKHYDYSAAYIIWSVENSLKNLQTEYLDLLLLHRPSPLMNPDEIAEAIEKLKNSGKILDFGVSNFSASQTALIAQKTKVNYNQIQLSATHLEPMRDGSLDYMLLNHITPMAWNPLGSIFKDKLEKSHSFTILLEKLEKKYNQTADVLLLSWIMQHPSGICPVIGTTNFDRIKNSINAITLKLDLEDWFSVWTESTGVKVP